MLKTTLLAASLVVSASASASNEFEPALRDLLETRIMAWAGDPVIVEAVRAQNALTSAYSQDDIDALDQRWRSEVGLAGSEIINSVLNNPAAAFLRAQVESAGGAITEIFVMDSRGLNVAASAVTSDYWQGDEAKFSETYPRGVGASHIGEVEFDESSQTYQSQISVAITDPATNEVVGAITVGIDAQSLF